MASQEEGVERALIARICSHFGTGFDFTSGVDADFKLTASRVSEPTRIIFCNYVCGLMDETSTIRAVGIKFSARLLNYNGSRGHNTTHTTLYIIQCPGEACRVFQGAHKFVVFRQGYCTTKEGSCNGSDEYGTKSLSIRPAWLSKCEYNRDCSSASTDLMLE